MAMMFHDYTSLRVPLPRLFARERVTGAFVALEPIAQTFFAVLEKRLIPFHAKARRKLDPSKKKDMSRA